MHCCLCSLLVFLYLCQISSLQAKSDFPAQLIPIAQDLVPITNVTVLKNHHDSPPFTLYAAVSTDSWSVLVPDNGYNNKLVKPSKQAKNHDCLVATNGGPFHVDGSSVGTVISNGALVSTSPSGVGFGKAIMPNQTAVWVMGDVQDIFIIRREETILIQNFVTGFDWLVYNSENIANLRNNTTGAVHAARTTVGIDHDGRLVLLVFDGCEKCLRNKGWTLEQVADVMIHDFGIQFGMNLDGGGSSVFVEHGRVKSKPTCLDIPIVCERAVTTVMCLTHEPRVAST